MATGTRADVEALVDADYVVELAKGICRLPSMRPNEKATALYLARELERLGFETDLQEVVPDRPNVLAISRGSPRFQSFVLHGHTDMPAPVQGWRRDPFDPWVEDGVLYGGGIGDMKGGVAALVGAAAAVVKAPVAERGDVMVVLVVHHDTIGLGAKYFLAANSWRIDAGILGEPTNLKVQLFHGGAWGFEIKLRGIPRHQSYLEEGVSAIEGAMKILQRLDVSRIAHTPDPRYSHLPRVVVGYLTSTGPPTGTAEECVMRGDIRFLPSMTIEGMRADLRRLVDEVCRETPGLSGSVTTVVQQMSYEMAPDAPVIRGLVDAHTRVTGAPPIQHTGLPAGAFITDAADFIRQGIPMALYGPCDWRSKPDEGVPVRDLETAARVYAATCLDVVTTPRR